MDIRALQPLPPFTWQQAGVRDIDRDYFAFYSIDFSAEWGEALSHHFGNLPLGGYEIAVHYFTLPENTRTVVLLHGYYDHVGLYGHLIRALLLMGCNVLAHDLPGHGLSSGERAGIGSFEDYQRVLKALLAEAQPHLKTPLFLIGQSTGGAIAMDYVMNNSGHGISRMVLLAPLVIPRHWIYLQGVLFTIGLVAAALPRSFTPNSHDADFLLFVRKKDPLQSRWVKRSWAKALFHWEKHFLRSPACDIPTLLFQGDKDTTVDWRYDLRQIRKKFTRLQVVQLEGAMHHLVNESRLYRDRIEAGIRDFLAG